MRGDEGAEMRESFAGGEGDRHVRHGCDDGAARCFCRVIRCRSVTAYVRYTASGPAMRPTTALAATTSGDARYTCPGPERPGKLRLIALTVTCSLSVLTPGPALMHAPHDGLISSAPAR